MWRNLDDGVVQGRLGSFGMAVVLLAMVTSCGGGSSSASDPSGLPAQHEEYVLMEVQRSIDAAENVLVSAQLERAVEARLRASIDSAREELARLRTACAQQRAHDRSACTTAPSPAVMTAGDALARSLGDMSHVLASKRRIIPPDDPDKPGPCAARPVCPHLGGDAHHNECADREPPNKWPGCDAHVEKSHFDAITAQGVLWEVKTDAWSGYSDFLKRLTLLKHTVQAKIEHHTASSCGYEFVFAVADAELYARLKQLLEGITLRHLPRCAR